MSISKVLRYILIVVILLMIMVIVRMKMDARDPYPEVSTNGVTVPKFSEI